MDPVPTHACVRANTPEAEPGISVLRNLEQRIENLVEGVFSRAFSSQVQPVELARKLAKEMDAHRTASVSRTYVPNQYIVWLSVEDHRRLEGYERSLEQELSAYLLEHARRKDYALLTRPEVKLQTDDRLRLGEFGIQTRLVKPPARQGEEPSLGEQGHTMVYSVPPKQSRRERRRPEGRFVETKAIVTMDDRRFVLDGPVAVLGRSRGSDCVFSDPNISRKHAELRRGSTGDWQIVDLGSTNGIKVNDRRVDRSRLSPGDEVTLGTTKFVFDIEQ
jgi:Protein of unknown function (DUF3662)/FHA domain